MVAASTLRISLGFCMHTSRLSRIHDDATEHTTCCFSAASVAEHKGHNSVACSVACSPVRTLWEAKAKRSWTDPLRPPRTIRWHDADDHQSLLLQRSHLNICYYHQSHAHAHQVFNIKQLPCPEVHEGIRKVSITKLRSVRNIDKCKQPFHVR